MRHLGSAAANSVGLTRVLRWVSNTPPAGVRVLLYHHVVEEQRQVFIEHARFVHSRYRVITPAEFDTFLAGGVTMDRPSVLFTFDDGFASDGFAARVLVEEFGTRAAFFVLPAFVDSAGDPEACRRFIDVHFPSCRPLASRLAPLTWEDIATLARAGHRIGSHTRAHPRLRSLARAELREELAGSRRVLEEAIGAPVEWFAVPYGGAGELAPEIVAEVRAVYRVCFTGIRGLNASGQSPLAVLRESMSLAWSVETLRCILDGGWDVFSRAARRNVAEAVTT